MNKYLIKSEHHIYKLNEDRSEGENVNYYEMSGEVRGNTCKEAIKNYIENVLFFTYNEDCFEIGVNSKNEIIFRNIVDEDNDEDKDGKYSSVNFLYIYKIVEIDFKKDFKMKAKVYEKGLFLYANIYKNIFNLLKDRCEDYSYFQDAEYQIYWFHTDEIIPLAEDILNKKEPTNEEKRFIEFLTANGFEIDSCCGKWEISKKKPFENILFYR